MAKHAGHDLPKQTRMAAVRQPNWEVPAAEWLPLVPNDLVLKTTTRTVKQASVQTATEHTSQCHRDPTVKPTVKAHSQEPTVKSPHYKTQSRVQHKNSLPTSG